MLICVRRTKDGLVRMRCHVSLRSAALAEAGQRWALPARIGGVHSCAGVAAAVGGTKRGASSHRYSRLVL